MKKTIFILLASVSLMWIGCSKKNDSTPLIRLTPANAKAADIVGKWIITADTTFSNVNTQSSVNTVSGSPFFQFNNDGTGTLGTDSQPPEGVFNYSLTNGTLVLTVPNPNGGTITYATFSVYAITKGTLGLRRNNDNTHEDAWLIKQP